MSLRADPWQGNPAIRTSSGGSGKVRVLAALTGRVGGIRGKGEIIGGIGRDDDPGKRGGV